MRAVAIAALAGVLVLSGTAEARDVKLVFGTEVPLATSKELSSKANVKGDVVDLVTTSDVLADGVVVIPKGTAATGQVIDARAKGGLGMSGKLVVRPLYLQIGSRTVRLAGDTADRGSISAGQVVGMILLTPIFSGRSATIPAGTALRAIVEKTVTLVVPDS